MNEKITTYEELADFIDKRTTSSIQAIYQPVTIRTLLEKDGTCTKKEIMLEILKHNPQLEDKKSISNPAIEVLENKVLLVNKDSVSLLAQNLTNDQKLDLVHRCDKWINYINALVELDNFKAKGLPDSHVEALKWFFKRGGKNYTKARITSGKRPSHLPPEELDEDVILHGGVKGVYKPKGDEYAQSIQLVPKSKWGLEIDRNHPTLLINYDFKDPQKYKDQISWMKKCFDNNVPIGIFFRVAKDKYMCLGLGKITSHTDTVYEIESYGISESESKKLVRLALTTYDSYHTEADIDKLEKIDWEKFLQTLDVDDERFKQLRIPPETLERQPTKIREIVENVKSGKWIIPKFQRYYVWDKEQVRQFLSSIFFDYYVGSLLLWYPKDSEKLDSMAIDGVDIEKPTGEIVILDGQQRVTSLNYAFNPPQFKKGKKNANFPGYFFVDFKAFLEGGGYEDVIIATEEQLDERETFERLLFPLYLLNDFGINHWIGEFKEYFKNLDADSRLKISELADIIRNKLFRMYTQFEIPRVLLPKSVEFDSVATVFEKLNSTGKPLGTFDLLNVRLSRYGVPLRKLWDDNLDDYPKIREYFEEKPEITKLNLYIIEAISLAYTKLKSCKRKDILDLFVNNKETVDSFTDKWKDMSKYISAAIEHLEDIDREFGVVSKDQLPYEPMIPVIAALLREIDVNFSSDQRNCIKKMHYWYWTSVFDVRYSSGVEAKKSSDFKDLVSWFADDKKILSDIVAFRENYDIKLRLKEVQKTSSSIYRGILCMLAKNGAYDFEKSLVIGKQKPHKDHIFPKSKFENDGIENSILNMTWLSGDTNVKSKRNRPPSEYIIDTIQQKYQGKESEFLEILETHCMNNKCLEYLKKDDFEKFIDERNNIILDQIRKLIGAEKEKELPSMIRPETPYTNLRILRKAVSSCSDYVYLVDKYFDPDDFDILMDGLNENIKQVKIISIVNNVDYKIKMRFIRFREELAKKGIMCEMRAISSPSLFRNHDRWLISKNKIYNTVSGSTARKGDVSLVTETKERPPVEEWWNNGWDIIKDWDKIQDDRRKFGR